MEGQEDWRIGGFGDWEPVDSGTSEQPISTPIVCGLCARRDDVDGVDGVEGVEAVDGVEGEDSGDAATPCHGEPAGACIARRGQPRPSSAPEDRCDADDKPATRRYHKPTINAPVGPPGRRETPWAAVGRRGPPSSILIHPTPS